jgi:predicted ATPase
VQEQAEAATALAVEQEFTFWSAQGTILSGWGLAAQGQHVVGIAQMEQGLASHRAMGAELVQPYYLAMLAEVYGNTEQVEAGGQVVAEGLAKTDMHGERWWEAELYRLKGELLLRMPRGLQHTAEAEACFRQAIDIAHRQHARGWELRVALSLSRLWQRQGKRDAARQLLAESYGWCTEGFDTTDLQEARALLEELA